MAKRYASELIAGVNIDAVDISPCCGWSGCPSPAEFIVEHPALRWVQTCRECVEIFLKGEIEFHNDAYAGIYWGRNE